MLSYTIFFMLDICFDSLLVSNEVKDNLGESVIGANVTEKGTTNGMITDLDGNFSLTVQKNATLVISYIGYVTKRLLSKETLISTLY